MRKIAAQDVKPGMEIEYEHGDWTFRVVVGRCEESHGEVWVFSLAGVGRFLENGQKVTVLREAQPDEPTAFGACIEVAGVTAIRDADGDWSKNKRRPSEQHFFRWEDLCGLGLVTIINADPFSPPAQDATEPRTWDRWEDVPEMTPVRVGGIRPIYRKVGDRIECKRGGSWTPAYADECDLNKCSPFTEVLDA